MTRLRPVGHVNTNIWLTNTHITVGTHTWFYTHATAPGPVSISTVIQIKQVDPAYVRMCAYNCLRRLHNTITINAARTGARSKC